MERLVTLEASVVVVVPQRIGLFSLLDAACALPKGTRLLWISDCALEIEKVFCSSRS